LRSDFKALAGLFWERAGSSVYEGVVLAWFQEGDT
jgi:hypothetical protein